MQKTMCIYTIKNATACKRTNKTARTIQYYIKENNIVLGGSSINVLWQDDACEILIDKKTTVLRMFVVSTKCTRDIL